MRCIPDAPACKPSGVEKKCIFPFKYHGVTYNQCIKKNHDRLWCSTKTDANDNHLTGEYGNCGPCQGDSLLRIIQYSVTSQSHRPGFSFRSFQSFGKKLSNCKARALLFLAVVKFFSISSFESCEVILNKEESIQIPC